MQHSRLIRRLFGLALTLLIAIATLPGTGAHASCVCRCVNGTMQPLCSSAIAVPPICPPTVCGIVPPSIPPIMQPTIPPIGTQSCRQAQVQNPFTGQFEWQTICR